MSDFGIPGSDDSVEDISDPTLRRVVAELRAERPEDDGRGPELVMAAVRDRWSRAGAPGAATVPTRTVFDRIRAAWQGGRILTAVPGRAAAALALTTGVILGALWLNDGGGRSAVATAGAERSVQFVLREPGATSVAVAGDFNDWSPLPLHRSRTGDVWTIDLRLTPGRHTYAFQIDGERWVADERAATTGQNEFGISVSVLLLSEDAA